MAKTLLRLLVLLLFLPTKAATEESVRTSLFIGKTSVIIPVPAGMVGMDIKGYEADKILGGRGGDPKLLWMFITPEDNAKIRKRQNPALERTVSIKLMKNDEQIVYALAAFEDFKAKQKALVASPEFQAQMEKRRTAWNEQVKKQPVRQGYGWHSRGVITDKIETLGWAGDGKGWFGFLQRSTVHPAVGEKKTQKRLLGCRAAVLAAGKLLWLETVTVEHGEPDQQWVRSTCLDWLKQTADLNISR